MASTDNVFGSLYQIKLTDDVTNLLSTPVNAAQQKLIQNSLRQQQNNNIISTPSTSRLSTTSTLSATSNDTITGSFSTSIDLRNLASRKFEEQIKYLDKQAKELQYKMDNSTAKDVSIASSVTPQTIPTLPKNPPPPLPINQIGLIDTIPMISSTSSSSMRNTADIRDEETFYEKIK